MKVITPIAILVVVLAGCSEAESQRVTNPEQVVEANSCAIACPEGTAYPGLSGSVTCADGYAPACQCVDSDEKMAGCEAVP